MLGRLLHRVSLLSVALLALGLPGFAVAQDVSPSLEPIDPQAELQGTLLAPRAFRAAAEAIKPQMVRIETFGGLTAQAAGAGGFRPGEGPTTGVIVSADGLILTSTFNFLKKPPIITVVLPSGDRKVAQMRGKDETRKLCLLKIETTESLPVPQWVPRDELRVGQWAIALGVGFGEKEAALSAGIISAVHRMGDKAVQTDANLSPANYGGPLIDIEGRLIGICVPLSPGGNEAAAGAEWYDSGIGFAVPLPPEHKIFTALKEGKTLERGFLGVQTKQLEKHAPGAEVLKIVPKSGAETAKLAEKDIIVAVDGTPALDPTHLTSLMQRYVAGDELELEVRRGEETLKLKATLGKVPPPEAKPKPKPEVKKVEDPAKKPEDQPPKDNRPAEDQPAEEEEAPAEKPAE